MLLQEAVDKLSYLSDNSLRMIIALADEAIRQEKEKGKLVDVKTEEENKEWHNAFREIEELREKWNFPADFDYEKEREENFGGKLMKFDCNCSVQP